MIALFAQDESTAPAEDYKDSNSDATKPVQNNTPEDYFSLGIGGSYTFLLSSEYSGFSLVSLQGSYYHKS